jgi:hypothetical protein
MGKYYTAAHQLLGGSLIEHFVPDAPSHPNAIGSWAATQFIFALALLMLCSCNL